MLFMLSNSRWFCCSFYFKWQIDVFYSEKPYVYVVVECLCTYHLFLCEETVHCCHSTYSIDRMSFFKEHVGYMSNEFLTLKVFILWAAVLSIGFIDCLSCIRVVNHNCFIRLDLGNCASSQLVSDCIGSSAKSFANCIR